MVVAASSTMAGTPMLFCIRALILYLTHESAEYYMTKRKKPVPRENRLRKRYPHSATAEVFDPLAATRRAVHLGCHEQP